MRPSPSSAVRPAVWLFSWWEIRGTEVEPRTIRASGVSSGTFRFLLAGELSSEQRGDARVQNQADGPARPGRRGI
jgi:hypothetical protein